MKRPKQRRKKVHIDDRLVELFRRAVPASEALHYDASHDKRRMTTAEPKARRLLPFRQNDLTRAIKAAKAAGEQVSKVEIDKDGKIVVTLGKPDAPRETREIVL